ncbi:MAG: hypothetical protein CSA21_05770 [Deltaproteobacteria bacterium]|nr:MAG: hypothetical protein CSA21_05770 [Deltaproteobacteria bacterium]
MFRRTLFLVLLILCPYCGVLGLLYSGQAELARDLLTLLLVGQVILCVPFSKLFIRIVVVRDLREFRDFVVSMKKGGSPLFAGLPNQTEEEDDLLLLKRALNSLSRVVTNYRMRSSECLSAARQDMSRYRELAEIDQLTGVYNRRAFDQELLCRIAWAEEDGGIFYLLFLDLDDFKVVNDTHGHQVGDEMLVRIGNILQSTTRDGDFPFRYGGDEFGLILQMDERDAVQRIAARIRNHFVGNPYDVDVSIGGVCFSRGVFDKEEAFQKLCRRADEALYMSKQSKHNRSKACSGCVLFDT